MIEMVKEIENPSTDSNSEPEQTTELTILVNEDKINEEEMKVKIDRNEFRKLFGPNAKPRKGDYLSLSKLNKKFKVTKSKKFKGLTSNEQQFLKSYNKKV